MYDSTFDNHEMKHVVFIISLSVFVYLMCDSYIERNYIKVMYIYICKIFYFTYVTHVRTANECALFLTTLQTLLDCYVCDISRSLYVFYRAFNVCKSTANKNICWICVLITGLYCLMYIFSFNTREVV